MYIKSVSQNIKDVFIGQGWSNWIRLDVEQQKILKASFKVSPSLFKTIMQKVHK